MRKLFKKAISFLLVAVMTFGVAPLSGFVGLELSEIGSLKKLVDSVSDFFDGFTTKAEAAIYSGKCGDNLTWTLDRSTGVLSIDGTGDMYDYEGYRNEAPWADYDHNVHSLIIGENVTSIGAYAFYDCEINSTITISKNINKIGERAFTSNPIESFSVSPNNLVFSSDSSGVLYNKDKTVLIQYPIANPRTSFSIPNGVITIESHSFGDVWTSSGDGTELIENVTIPDTVKTIKHRAFYSCQRLKSVSLGNSLSSIGEEAFSHCTSLLEISIPDNVETIESHAFSYCDSLSEVFIGKSAIKNEDGDVLELHLIFRDCLIKSYTVSNEHPFLYSSEGVVFSKFEERNELIAYPLGNPREFYAVPEGTTDINSMAFYDFYQNENCKLKSIKLPSTIVDLTNYQLQSLNYLEEITVDNSHSTLLSESGVLFNKDKTKLYLYPKNKTGSKYNVPDSVESISSDTFKNAKNLFEISIPESVTSIGDDAFYKCGYYNNVNNWQDGSLYIDNWLVEVKEGVMGSFVIKEGTVYVAERAFEYKSGITELTIPSTLKDMNFWYSLDNVKTLYFNSKRYEGDSFGDDLPSLTTVYFGDTVEVLEGKWSWRDLFADCKNLKTVTFLPTYSFKKIKLDIFSGCVGLDTLILPDSTEEIHVNISAINSCDSLQFIHIPPNAEITGWGYNGEDKTPNTNMYFCSNSTDCKAKKKLEDLGYVFKVCDGSHSIGGKPLEPNEEIELISSDPANGEKYFSLEKDIVLTFNQKIEGVSVDAISIKDYETDKVVCTASINCIEKNGNSLTLKHMVHTPIVDENGKTVEGGKLKGNMKYYLDIPSYAIRFSDGYFVGLSSKDNLAFSTYISKNRSLEDYGFKQEYTEGSIAQETISNNQAEFKYFYRNNEFSGKAMDDFCIPGLKEGMVPQGLTYYSEKHWYLISAYHKSDLPAEEKNNSVIYALNENGEFVAQFNIHTAYGKDSRIHAGGIAVSKHNLYLTYYDSQIAYIPLSELNVPDYTVKDVCIRSSVDLKDLMNGTGTAYLSYSENYYENILWTGNFYCTTFEAKLAGAAATEDETGWNTPASEKANSIMLGYSIDGTDSLSEWNSLTQIVKNDGATYTVYLPDKYDGIQGATTHNGVVYLSRAEWRPSNYDNNTALLAHEIYLLGQPEITLPDKSWVVINNLPGAENIFVKDNKLYCVYEASALGEINFFLWNTKVETDVIWEIDIKKLLKNTRLGTVNCPVDVEIYDEETGELVGRIKDNVVDSEIADKDNSVPMEVDGDTKYYWLPTDKKYKVVLIGNDIGTMDYSASLFDENAQIKERANFYDVELTDGLTYTDEVESDNSLSQYILETEDGTKIKPDQYFNNMQNAKAEISVSAGEGGTVTESFSAVCGDKVTVEASAKDGYIFSAWFEDGQIVSTDAEYSFVVKGNTSLEAEFIAFSIHNPTATTISYGDAIILHADIKGALSVGSTIKWTASNDNFDMVVSDDGKTCKISPKKSGNTTFTATVYDANENAISSDEQVMTSKAGFFDKIIAFFKKLFGLTKTIPQIYNGIF